ncbi:MAG TPA: hypothetical protein VFC19_51385 [Candidatus Limnocylindrales bacterium]|nr:hypothetical protein [Candidatus Limnocylindrales bacterium]
MTGTSETIVLLQRVSEFLKKLSPEDLQALETGEARLAVVHKTPPRKTAAAPLTLDVEQVNTDLKAINDRSMAARYLTDLKLPKPQLVQLAKGLDVPIVSKDSIATIMAKIVEQKVGYRLDTNAILGAR